MLSRTHQRSVILITGATSGIGRAVAADLTRRGHTVFGTGRAPTTATLDGFALLPLDISSTESVRAAAAAVIERAGRIDVLINNVGAMLFGAAEETTIAELSEQLELNLFGTARMVQAALPALRAQGGGKIINMSSLGGRAGLPYLSAYNAAKFALEGYSEALRLELLPYNILVSLVEPAGVKSGSLDRSQHRAAGRNPAYNDAADRIMARMRVEQERDGIALDTVAAAVARIVAARRPQLRYTVGGQARMVTLLQRWLPQRWYEAAVSRQLALPPAGSEM